MMIRPFNPSPWKFSWVSSEVPAYIPHFVKPFVIMTNDPDAEFARLVTLLADWPRTSIEHRSETYVHATCRSRRYGFIDDLEFELSPTREVIHVRSAARTGGFDFGVNRWRVQRLRKHWRQRSIH